MKISETIAIVFAVVLLGALLIGGLGYTNYLLSKAACDQFGRRTGVTTIYEFPSGCYKIVNGKWWPLQFQEYPIPNIIDAPEEPFDVRPAK